MTIGEKIKQARLSKGLTLQEIADKMSLTQGTLSKYENGDIKNIPNTRLKKLSKILDVDISYFYEGSKNKKSIIIQKLIELTENNKVTWISPNNPNENIFFKLSELIQELNGYSNDQEIQYYSQSNENEEIDIENTIYFLEVGDNWYCIYKTAISHKLFVFKFGDYTYSFIKKIELIAEDNFKSSDTDLSTLYDLASGNEDSNKGAFLQDLINDLDNLRINADNTPFNNLDSFTEN